MTGAADLVVIGIDAEWVYDSQKERNNILSYQYAGRTSKGTWSGIVYTDGPDPMHRWKLADFIGLAIKEGRKEGRIGRKWPTTVYVAAHFTRADLSAFKDFQDRSHDFDGIQKTFATIIRPYETVFYDKGRNKREINIWLIDTLLLTPKRQGLAYLGEMLGLPKIDLPAEDKQAMDDLLKRDKQAFESYAIRDAEISALHAWQMADFAKESFGKLKPPVTLGSLSVDHLKSIWAAQNLSLLEVLGKERFQKPQFDKRTRRFITEKSKPLVKEAHDHVAFATECFHGGRNEAYVFGFTEVAEWTDYDLSGAYTTAMAAIRIPDFSKLRVTTNIRDFKADELGLARVQFKFPSHTRFPCLPVRTENGLIFPLEGTAYVASPEIALARDMNAELTIEHGLVVPWKSQVRPFELFSRSIREKRSQHKKGSLWEETWKEIGNSLYGKLAQGLMRKRTFDSRQRDMKTLPESDITQPYLAAYTTSLVRAVLGELLHRIPPSRTVVSATTDGFLTDAQDHEIDVTGPLSMLFGNLQERLTGQNQVLEVKHKSAQLLCWKTRGQADVDVTGFVDKPVIAKAGIKPPEEAHDTAKGRIDAVLETLEPDEQPSAPSTDRISSDWILELFLNRTSDTKLPVSSLISMREMIEEDIDLVPVDKDGRVNMEFDWKRELINPAEQKPYGLREVEPHFYASSRPWQTEDDFRRVRTSFDKWRTSDHTLKSITDWEDWQAFRTSDQVSGRVRRYGSTNIVDQALREIRTAYAKEMWGLKNDRGYKAFAKHLTAAGYPTSVTGLKNAKRRRKPEPHLFPPTKEVKNLIRTVQEFEPQFEGTELIQ